MTRKYSVILGNLGNTKDRFCNGYKTNPTTTQMLKNAAAIPFVRGIELVGTWDISPDNVGLMKAALADLDLACVSIIPDLFGDPDYRMGSYSNADAAIRRKALDYTRGMCDIARELSCATINLWPGQDGYDYLLTADYARQRQWMQEAIATLAAEYPDLRFSLEYKPKEPRTHSLLARMSDTLLMVGDVGLPNVGVTIDTGHAFAAGEVVGESVVLAQRAGNRLFHMHFNDNYTSWDDDMIVGSIHLVDYFEMLYWLEKTGYEGWYSMDQYPYREDGYRAIRSSVLFLQRIHGLLEKVGMAAVEQLIRRRDPIGTTEFIRENLIAVA
jgi:xylose isomerase